MKQLETEMFTFTEIGGVGEMIYKAVRFPDYYWEYDHTLKEDVIIPLFTFSNRPIAGTDYSITGQDLLASLCNLYKKINAPNGSDNISELVWDWCRHNIYPYQIDELCENIEIGDFMNPDYHVQLQRESIFEVNRFVTDTCNLGIAYEYYDTLTRLHYNHDAESGRSLYYEGRIMDSIPFLEKYRQYSDDAVYLQHFDAEYDTHLLKLIDLFPGVKMRLRGNPKTHKIEMGAEVNSVFDIAWYSFARMVASVAPPADIDQDYMYSQGSILTCMACGEYFVRHSSRQRYCDNPNCQAERNNKKARAYYKRKNIVEKGLPEPLKK